jgi:RIO-like serine/threonine protein kinase
MQINLTYEEARSNTEKIIIRGQLYKADVYISQSNTGRFIVKDYTRKGFWERNFVGRLVISREARAYAALAGIDGLPARFKRLSPFAFAVEYLEGQDLGAIEQQNIGPEVIRQFEGIVRAIHDRGWVHLDLHRRTNILLVDGKVYVVDLASALHPGGIFFIGRCLTRAIGIADRLSLIKMKTIFSPQSLTRQDRIWLSIRNGIMPSKWKIP